MSVTEEIRAKLQAAFQPDQLEVIDESEAHRGHSGYQDGGESHFHVHISSPFFAALSRLQRHREIHSAIGPELIARIHALAITVNPKS